MSNVFTVAGATMGVVADVPTTLDDDDTTGYPSLTYVSIGEIEDLGSAGVVFELVTFNAIGSRDTVKRKGTRNYGNRPIVLGRDTDDAGQVILEAGANGAEIDTTHSFDITLQNGDHIYFTGQIMSFEDNLGTVNNIVKIGVNIEIENSIFVAAA
jgi:hypothetical protein